MRVDDRIKWAIAFYSGAGRESAPGSRPDQNMNLPHDRPNVFCKIPIKHRLALGENHGS